MNTWIGSSDNFHNSSYWTDGIPTPDDIIVLSGLPSVSIGLPGVPPPPPAPYSHQSVTFPDSMDNDFEPVYEGIRILNGYGGTATFPATVEFGEWTQNSGTTAQAADTVISVTGTFGWVGGAINATSNEATMKLFSGGQIGEDATNLNSGSKFVLDSGADVTQSGVLNILNGLGITVREDASFEQSQLINQVANQPVLNAPAANAVAGLHVEQRASIKAEGGSATSVLVDAGGQLNVGAKGFKVTGTLPGDVWSMKVAGDLFIRNGATLEVAEGVRVAGDLITWKALDSNIEEKVTIKGLLRTVGGTITLGMGTGTTYSKLEVAENVQLWGGTFEPKLCGGGIAHDLCDKIITKKKIDFGSDFTVTPEMIGAWPENSFNMFWVVMSKDGFVDGTNPTNGKPGVYDMQRDSDPPIVEDGSVYATWGDPDTCWRVEAPPEPD